MANTIQIRRGANASLPTLNAGELGFSTDTHQLYVGDGAENHEIAKTVLNTSPSFDTSGNGLKGKFTNGNAGSVAFGDVCYMALDGELEFADASQDSTMPALYMALETIAAGEEGEWLVIGIARNDAWNWVVGPGVAGLIYVSPTGTTGATLTQTKPSLTGEQVQIVGHALSADIMMFNPIPILVEIT